MFTEENKAIARRIIEDFINKGDLNVADQLFAEDFINHNPARGTTPDREGMKQFINYMLAAFPNQILTIDDLIAEGDKVVLRMTGRGTHTGELLGIPATGKQIEVPGISILRIADGKMVDRWNISDNLLLLQWIRIVSSVG